MTWKSSLNGNLRIFNEQAIYCYNVFTHLPYIFHFGHVPSEILSRGGIGTTIILLNEIFFYSCDDRGPRYATYRRLRVVSTHCLQHSGIRFSWCCYSICAPVVVCSILFADFFSSVRLPFPTHESAIHFQKVMEVEDGLDREKVKIVFEIKDCIFTA